MQKQSERIRSLNEPPQHRRSHMPAHPSNSYLIVLGCFFIVVLHVLSQAVHLSSDSTASNSLHDPILSKPHSQYEAVARLAKQLYIESLPIDSILAGRVDDPPVFDDETGSDPAESNPDFRQVDSDIIGVEVRDSNLALNLTYDDAQLWVHTQNYDLQEAIETPTSKDHKKLTDSTNTAYTVDAGHSHRCNNCMPKADDQAAATEYQNVDGSNDGLSLMSISEISSSIPKKFEGNNPAAKMHRRHKMTAARGRRAKHKKMSRQIKGILSLTNVKDSPSPDPQVSKSEQAMPATRLSGAQTSESNNVTDGIHHNLAKKIKQNQPLKLRVGHSANEPINPHEEHASPQPKSSSTAEERLAWLRDNWDKIKILYTDKNAKEFPKRVNQFLLGDTEACQMRFFMTWIAPLSAFGSKEWLALQSVFKIHPSACLIILSPTFDSLEGRLILAPLSDKGFKVLAITPHIPFLLQSTPAERWFMDLSEGLIDPGTISIYQNLSNLLRLVVLYKYGGVYIDNDIIVMKSFENLSNAIGAQSIDQETGQWTRLNNAVLVFNKENPLLFKFIEEFAITFNGSMWGHNGPYLVTRVMMRENNSGVEIMDPLAFYPIHFLHIGSFFRAPNDDNERQWVAAKMAQLIQHTFTLHLWNKLSRNMVVEPGSVMDMVFRHVCILCEPHTES